MRTPAQIHNLLDELEERTADDLEDQDLDFKSWPDRSVNEALKIVVEMAICFANGGGGTVVFGVEDRVRGRARAIRGVPLDVSVNQFKRAVYDRTDPKLTPAFEEIAVPEGTGRLLVMQIYEGLPPYTDTSGQGKVRVGKECQPLTGTARRRLLQETGESDFSAAIIPGDPQTLISPVALEQLRLAAQRERAPEELLGMTDLDLLDALGVLRQGQLTRAGLLVAGREEALREHLPTYVWTYLPMRSETDYDDRLDSREAIPIALQRLNDRIGPANPITTITHGFFHFEYRTYPEIALREAIMNAFSHCDYRLPGPILIKQYSHAIEISNPGGFIGGITPENILHHRPVPRNPHLVEALIRLRLVNRSHVGIPRMFSALLAEGKEPPRIAAPGEAVIVTFVASEFSPAFRAFVEGESRRGRRLGVDHLLILHFLLSHAEIDLATARRVCQRTEDEARDLLNHLEHELGYLERGGTGRSTYWCLRPDLYRELGGTGHPERHTRIDWEAAKTRVLSVLHQRSRRDEPGLTNTEVRRITYLGREQAKRLMDELRREGQAQVGGRGRSARWHYAPVPKPNPIRPDEG